MKVRATTKNALVLIYNHPEFYPPTLNAIDEVSQIYDNVFVLSRNTKKSDWTYPYNTKLFTSGNFIEISQSEKKTALWKARSFFNFLMKAIRLKRKYRPEVIICYDAIPLLAARVMNECSLTKVKLWYHNHDISDRSLTGNMSIGGIAFRSEQSYFHKISVFTLPSIERLIYFPMDVFRGTHFIIPNFPSLKRYSGFHHERQENLSVLKFIYQGYVSDGHGLEEFIYFIANQNNLFLTIVGIGNEDYILKLKRQVLDLRVTERVIFKEGVSYKDLKSITMEHHVGLAILKPVSIAFKTAALASNKIYEYAACGLAVLYFDDPYHIKYLSRFDWAFSCDLSGERLSYLTEKIRNNYKSISSAARCSFETELNFEKGFYPVKEFLTTK